MPRAAPLALLAAALAAPAAADTCAEEIRALFTGGTLDSFARPPHVQVRESFAADGTLTSTYEARIESPLEMVSGVRGLGRYMLMADRQAWTVPTMEGPWSPAGMTITEDMMEAQRAVPRDQAKNLSETECLGTVDLDGAEAVAYRFRTKVDPDPARGNSWWGSLDTVHLDPATGNVMRWEQTEQINSWSEGISDDVHVTRFSYDPAPVIEPPE